MDLLTRISIVNEKKFFGIMVARLFDKNENNKIKCIIHAILLAGFLICALLKCNQICSYLLVEDNMQ